MRIALDAFGGDNAPQSTIEGAMLSLEEAENLKLPGFEILLVGSRDDLEAELQEEIPAGLKVIDMPTGSSRIFSDPVLAGDTATSPIRTALKLHADGEVDAVVSAGPTSAQVIASLLELEKCTGITRPAVGSVFPTASGKSFLLDAGASLTASPHHLVQFAVMGHVYVKEIFGVSNPRIGLLNVGSEEQSGNPAVIEAHRLLADSGFNFTGYVEGNDLPVGKADVIVTNGFIGNVLLKYTEAIPSLVKDCLSNEDSATVFNNIMKRFDYQQFGGEPLLGVKGISVICHGASSSRAICAAILQTVKMVNLQLHDKLEAFLVDKFASYFSRVKYLRSFRRSFTLPGRFQQRNTGKD